MFFLLSLCAFFISSTFAIFTIPWILKIAHRHFLYDIPNERKLHKNPVPRLGGLAFFYCILFSMLSIFIIAHQFMDTVEQYVFSNSFFLCALLLLHIGGLKDDLIGVLYRHKFLLQIASSLLIVFSGLYINHFYGLFSIEAIPAWMGVPLTVLAIVFIINAINLIDGIDGLSSGISIIALLIYGTLFLMQDEWYYAILAFSSLGVLCIFFCYNVFGSIANKQKLFMGDSGSMMIGLILSVMVIKYMHYAPHSVKPFGDTLVMAISPILVPALDVLRVMLSRIRRRKHLFTADRSHIHHKLIDMGLGKTKALLFLLGVSCGFCLINFLLVPLFSTLAIFIFDGALWISGNMYLTFRIKKSKVPILAHI